MTRKGKPTVNTRCVANTYASAHERIVEFSFPNGSGGLISFTTAEAPDGGHVPIVNVYRTDAPVRVYHNGKGVGA